MLVLSIDIGIKNLAHCLFCVTDTSTSILNWDVIDVSKTGKCMVCLKQATHELNTSDSSYFYCKEHTSHTNKSLIELICLCKKISIPIGTKKEMSDSLKKCTKPISPSSMTDIGKQIIQHYNLFSNIDIVLIENQIGPIASKMKAVQGMVLQYWLMRNAKVECISSANKLKLFHQEKTTYAERKKLSIHYTKQVLLLNGLDDTPFLKHKKKDDLADTFLQGIWYFYSSIKKDKYTNCGLLKINCS